MNNMTLIPEDGLCIIDNEMFFDKSIFNIIDFPFHALQYHDNHGHIEPTDATKLNIEIFEDNDYILMAMEKATEIKITQNVPIPEPNFDELVKSKKFEIWNAGDIILDEVKANYTQAEIESWSKQEQGAKDILAGNTDTECAIFVSLIAKTRGIEAVVLAQKILANVKSYGELLALVVGEQQRLDDLIKIATTKEELDEIIWTFKPN